MKHVFAVLFLAVAAHGQIINPPSGGGGGTGNVTGPGSSTSGDLPN
jgi:hypothetical protein